MPYTIVIEGIDGVGKSYTIEKLKEWFVEKGINYLAYREPGSTASGEVIRGLLKSKKSLGKYSPYFLFLASRNELINKIRADVLLQNPQIILIDRFTPSTYAYQKQLFCDENVFAKTEQLSREFFVPDKVFYIKKDFDTIKENLARKNETMSYEEYANLIRNYDNAFQSLRKNFLSEKWNVRTITPFEEPFETISAFIESSLIFSDGEVYELHGTRKKVIENYFKRS